MHLLTLELIKLENKPPNSLTNFVGLFIHCATFLLFKFVLSFPVFSFVTVWKENEELVPFPTFGTIFTKKLLKICAITFSSLTNLPLSSVFHWLYFDVKEGLHRIPECFLIIYIIQVKVFVIIPFSFSKRDGRSFLRFSVPVIF